MEQLIYVSVPSASVGGGDVFDIVQKSATRNSARGITGFLMFAEGMFFQCVEGSSTALDDLMVELAHDPRHHSIAELSRKPITERTYPNWAMKRMHSNDGLSGISAQLKGLGIQPEVIHQVEAFAAATTVRAA